MKNKFAKCGVDNVYATRLGFWLFFGGFLVVFLWNSFFFFFAGFWFCFWFFCPAASVVTFFLITNLQL